MGPIKDENVDAIVTGFGTQGSVDRTRKKMSCWTDQGGPAMFSQ